MILSRIWYVILAFCSAVAIYVTYVAVGQYNRRNGVAMTEGLAADSQVVRWALQIDARRRLDALLVGSVDKGIQDSLVAANSKDKVPPKSKEDARKGLDGVLAKLPAEYKPDAIFAVDREGRVVAQIGYDAANAFDDFELGGYPAVFDALHGFLRDDTWVLGGRVYRVSARPVEYDVSQPPVGAIVGLRSVDARFAGDISKLTRTNVVFYANGMRLASAAGTEGFDEKVLEALAGELPKVEADKTYQDTGRSGFRTLGDNVGASFARFDGDAWELHAGYAVARTHPVIAGPMGFLNGADDKDKQSVSWPVIILVVVLGGVFGVGFTLLEHTMPMREMKLQAARLKKGELDFLQLPRFRYGYRPIAQDLNAGIERVAEKGGGTGRKQADLESILGPVPAQPSMSAFSFPGPGGDSAPASAPNPARITGPGAVPPSGPRPGLVGAPNGPGGFPAREQPSSPGIVRAPGMTPGFPAPPGPGPRPPGPPPPVPHARDQSRPNLPPGPPPRIAQPATPQAMPAQGVPNLAGHEEEREDEATKVGAVSKEILDAASGQHGAVAEDSADWLSVYEDFVRTKKQCNEPTDGLTFEKFQHTLRKNRDALVQRHGCKRVRFSVYVKEGRASLKATPVKE